MSDGKHTITDHDDVIDERPEPHPSAIVRLLPAVTFGLRAAALAGVVLSAGSLAAGLAGICDGGPTHITITTCCS